MPCCKDLFKKKIPMIILGTGVIYHYELILSDMLIDDYNTTSFIMKLIFLLLPLLIGLVITVFICIKAKEDKELWILIILKGFAIGTFCGIFIYYAIILWFLEVTVMSCFTNLILLDDLLCCRIRSWCGICIAFCR